VFSSSSSVDQIDSPKPHRTDSEGSDGDPVAGRREAELRQFADGPDSRLDDHSKAPNERDHVQTARNPSKSGHRTPGVPSASADTPDIDRDPESSS
jgi:hypothetical protein